MRKHSKQRSKRAAIAKVQMAPMIDMVFLLLVFFMCVSSISQAGLVVEVDLPDSKRSEVSDDYSSRVTITLDGEGALFFNGVPMPLNSVSTELATMVARTPKLKLNIRSDRNVEYSQIRELIQVAAGVGIYDYVYATYQSEL